MFLLKKLNWINFRYIDIMKAPFSKKAKQVFGSRKALKTINDKKSKGGSIHDLVVKGRNGRSYTIKTSQHNLSPV